MNFKNFSLDYLQPTGTTQTVDKPDIWADAVKYYGSPVLGMLQEGGHKTVQELFDMTKDRLKAPQLQLEQFVGVIDRMISTGQLIVTKQGQTPGDFIVALPLK